MNRNQFLKYDLLEGAVCEGRYGLPVIPAVNEIPKKIIPFNQAMTFPVEERKDVWVHFFIDDYQFERIWNNPHRYAILLEQFAGIIQPTFSFFVNAPLCTQLINAYRNQLLAHYFTKRGINVIPVPGFGDESTFNWCFEILPQNSVLALSTISNKDERIWLEAYKEIKRRLTPTAILIYGAVPQELKDDKTIIHYANFYEILKERNKKDDERRKNTL